MGKRKIENNMKSTCLKQRILNFLERQEMETPGAWINGGEIERLALEAGYKASNASRRCRELAKEGHIRRRENAKGFVEYRFCNEIQVFQSNPSPQIAMAYDH